MTMLDRMRQHRNWLKWSLFIVAVAMVIFFIPNFMRNPSGRAAAGGAVAVVEGREIRGDEFQRTYQAQIQAYRSAYGANMSDQLLRQLGVEQQILQQMVDERAALAEADRLDIRVSDDEVKQRILAIPSFQDNGVFIGEQRYRQILSMQRPPMTPTEFENAVRRSLVVDKLRTSLTEWLSIPDKELEQEYRRRNDKVKLAVVSFPNDSFRPDVSATDAEITSYFDAHKDDFRIPEKRKVRYLLVDIEAIRSKTVVPAADIERAYNDRITEYTTPEQVRASHILLKTEGKDEAAVRAQAEEVLKKAKAGANFAALAKQYSQDEGSAPNGGDLDYFGRGRMVPEFDAVAFAMEPGQISDLVKTTFGFHIIKLIEKKTGSTRSLEEVRPQLQDQLSIERAQAQASTLANSLRTRVTKASDLDTVAKEQGFSVQESDWFARDEPVLGLGASPELGARTFAMNQGDVAGPIQTGRGFVFASLIAKQDPYVPKVDEVKERVRNEVVRNKAKEFGLKKATEVAAKLKGAADFDKAVQAAGFKAQTTEMITRDSPIPDLGMAAEVTEAAFTLAPGTVSQPIATDTGSAVIKVLEKQQVTPQELEANKQKFRDDLLADRRNRFFAAYMTKAKQKMRIEVNREAVQKLVG
jgi:peptidyl-prolyl cis-trans isomerase D